MKRLILALLTLSLAFTVNAQSNVKTVGIKTSAICEMCKNRLEKDLTFEKGVKSVNLDLETKVLNIAYIDGKTNPELLKKRVTLVGYHADNLKRDPKAYEKLDPCCKDGGMDPKKKGGPR
jgi:periplasmic mercuric ion binding protein